MDSQAPISNHPVIDFSSTENLKPGTCVWLSTSKQVKDALEEHGFFLATYDNISSQLLNAFYQAIKEFFDLPMEKKSQFTSDRPFSGNYVGFPGPDGLPALELTRVEDVSSVEAVQRFTNLFFSSESKDAVSEIMQSYSKQVEELQEMILRMVCESYGVEKYYESLRLSLAYTCGFNKYGAAKLIGENLGLPAHSDGNFMTILHQNNVNGLEVKSKDGSWVLVDFPPSSFVVLAGDELMAWSNGRITSKVHRVNKPADEPRYSAYLICHKNGIVEAPKELVDDLHPLLFKPFDRFQFASLMTTKGLSTAEDKLKILFGV